MTDLRVLRGEMGLTQLAMAEAFLIPLNTLRMWDSGLRNAPDAMMDAARALAAEHRRQRELLPVTHAARLTSSSTTIIADQGDRAAKTFPK